MAYHPLLNALVAPAQQIGQQRPQGVGIPRPLPSQIRFGPVAPGLAQNSPFSGARVAAPGSPLAAPPAPTFAPAAQAGGPAAASLAPFMQTPQGGAPTLPIPGAGGGTGGVAPPSPYHPATPTTLGTGLGAPIQAPPGYTGTTLGTQISAPPPYVGTPGTGIGTGLLPTSPTLSTLLSALAQTGTKTNLSTGGSFIRSF